MNLTNIMGAAGAAVNPQARPTNQWSTKPFDCGGNVPPKHLAYAYLCFPCAAAHAKMKADKSNPIFNCLCFTPLGAYNSVRLSYGIVGDCKNDLIYGCLCMPCGTRQSWTEVNVLGPVAGTHGSDQEHWTASLFACEPNSCLKATFCPCIVAHDIRILLHDSSKDEAWFNYLCILPTSMYGQTRHHIGIRSEWPHPTCEDLVVGLFCYPCALIRANTEAGNWRMKQAGANALGGAVGSAKAKASNAAMAATNAANNAAAKFRMK
jgi:hypothetical protein